APCAQLHRRCHPSGRAEIRVQAQSEDRHARDKRCAVNGFCPDGYVPAREAIAMAAQYWFPERAAALERASVAARETTSDNSSAALARALSSPPIPDSLQHEFQDIVNQTVHRLRNVLQQAKLKAYYFGDLGSR